MVYYIFMNSNQTQIYRQMRRIHRQGRALIPFLWYISMSKSLAKAQRKVRHFLPPPLQFRSRWSIRRESIQWILGCLEIHYRLRREYALLSYSGTYLWDLYSFPLLSTCSEKLKENEGCLIIELKKKTFFPSCLAKSIIWNHCLHYTPA